MKKIFAYGVLFFLMLTGTETFAQEVPGEDVKPKCILHVEKISFKKPRTDCKSGFGICIRAQWYVLGPHTGLCWPTVIIGPLNFLPRIEKGEVYAGVSLRGEELILLLPEAIAELPDYKSTSLEFLEIEDKIKLITEDKWVRTILPQKAQVQYHEGYLMYALQLSK